MSTTADQTTTTPAAEDIVTTVIHCPAWCTARTNPGELAHEEYRQDGRRVLAHGGEGFGKFWTHMVCDAETGEILSVVAGGGDVDDREFDPAGLRDLAAQAIAAAQWIEAQR